MQPSANMPKISPLERKPLHQKLVEELRHLILSGDLPPGGKLIEKELCESFGVSRTPMREAVKTLAAEGLITLIPNRGAVVPAVSDAQILNAFAVMGALEGLAGELAALRMTEEERRLLHRHHRLMITCRQEGDRQGYYRHNRCIHDLFFAASGNDILEAARRQVQCRIVNLRFVAEIEQDEWDRAIREHEEMLCALDARDGAALGEVLRRHLASKQAHVARWLARSSTGAGARTDGGTDHGGAPTEEQEG